MKILPLPRRQPQRLLEGSDVSGFVFAGQELQLVVPRSEDHAALIDQSPLRNLLEAIGLQFHLDGVAQRANHAVAGYFAELGGEVEFGFLATLLLRPFERAGGKFRRYRHEDLVAAAVQPEVCRLHRQGQLIAGRLCEHGIA